MISMNLLAENLDPVISKMPAAEFGSGGILGIEGFIYEIRVSQSLAIVMDESQLMLLVEAALDQLPNMTGLLDEDADEADKLRREIADADKSIAELYAQAKELAPQQRQMVEHLIKRVEGTARDMRIKLASLDDRSDVLCPHCQTKMPRGFQFCRPCIQELPAKLYIRLKNAVGLHHHHKASDSFLKDAMDAALGYLKQHSSAVL